MAFVPVLNLLSMGYLYRLFASGKGQQEYQLPAWDWQDWKGLGLDGLRFLVLALVFIAVPWAVFFGLTGLLPTGSFLTLVPLIPIVFFCGPLMCASMYLYMVRQDFKDCFNVEALGLMLKGAAINYAVPTLAYIGFLGLFWVIPPIAFFFGGVIYFYAMGFAFRELELRKQ